MTDKLSERLHVAALAAYAEAQAKEGTSRLLSELQLLIDDEVATLEQQIEGLREAMRINTDFKLMALGLEQQVEELKTERRETMRCWTCGKPYEEEE